MKLDILDSIRSLESIENLTSIISYFILIVKRIFVKKIIAILSTLLQFDDICFQFCVFFIGYLDLIIHSEVDIMRSKKYFQHTTKNDIINI